MDGNILIQKEQKWASGLKNSVAFPTNQKIKQILSNILEWCKTENKWIRNAFINWCESEYTRLSKA